MSHLKKKEKLKQTKKKGQKQSIGKRFKKHNLSNDTKTVTLEPQQLSFHMCWFREIDHSLNDAFSEIAN